MDRKIAKHLTSNTSSVTKNEDTTKEMDDVIVFVKSTSESKHDGISSYLQLFGWYFFMNKSKFMKEAKYFATATLAKQMRSLNVFC